MQRTRCTIPFQTPWQERHQGVHQRHPALLLLLLAGRIQEGRPEAAAAAAAAADPDDCPTRATDQGPLCLDQAQEQQLRHVAGGQRQGRGGGDRRS